MIGLITMLKTFLQDFDPICNIVLVRKLVLTLNHELVYKNLRKGEGLPYIV